MIEKNQIIVTDTRVNITVNLQNTYLERSMLFKQDKWFTYQEKSIVY